MFFCFLNTCKELSYSLTHRPIRNSSANLITSILKIYSDLLTTDRAFTFLT